MLNYKQLYYFWHVARSGGVTRAAQQLHLTPQTISGQVAELEQSLGVALFNRVGRRLVLTAAGRQALEQAGAIFSLGADLEHTLRHVSQELTMQVGIADSVPRTLAFELLAPHPLMPEVSVSKTQAEDLSAYLVESEQIPAACGLGVLVDTDHSVKAAGGFLVQLMPGAPEELITKLEDNIFMMDQLTTILDEDGADAILPQVMRGLEPEIVLRHPMAYRCACSRARVEQALRQCGAQELQDMIAEGKDTQVHCQFCDAEYVFTPAQLQTLLDAENADAAAD